MPIWPAPEAAWYDATTSSRSTYSRCSAPIATIIDSVVQFGLAMMPRGRCWIWSGVDLGHDQRHVGVHPERAGVVHHDGTAGGRDRRPLGRDLVGHVEHGDVHAVEDLRGQLDDGELLAAYGEGLARGAGRRDEPDLAPHVLARGEQLAHDACRRRRSHRRRPGSGDRSSPTARCRRRRRPRLSPPSSNASCTARTAASRSVSRHTTETRISDVEIISMLTPAWAMAPKNLAATPGCERMPAPTSDTLPMWSS